MLTRREAVVAGAAAAAWAAKPGWARKRPPLARGVTFPGGVAAGAPRRSGISLWTDVAGLDTPGVLGVQVAADPDFKRTVAYRRVTVDPAVGTAQLRVQSSRLRPGRPYWYRFVSADGGSPAGRFVTLRPRDSREPVRIGFWTCQSWTEGFFTAHEHLAAEDDLDLVVCLGDFIYEYGGAAAGGRDDPVGTADTLESYRAKYRLYRTDPGLQKLLATHAHCFMWDDHEVVNNYWREGAGGATVDGFAQRQAAAYRAWFEHLPVPVVDGTRIYRSVRVGDLVDLFLLDERQYKDVQPCGDLGLTPCPDAAAPGRTFLGERQKAWLRDGLRRSTAPWKVVASGDMMMGLDQPAPGTPKFVDTWDGYQAERREVVEGWLADGVRDVVVMSGDDHDNYAGVLTTTGHGDGTPGAAEFVVPSMTSANTGELLGSNPTVTLASEADAVVLNSHLNYVNQRHHGYCLLYATERNLDVEYRHVTTIRAPTADVATAARFRVPRGRIELLAG